VILLVLVVVLWICVLAPSAWRRYAEHQGVGSIDHFHHQLELLEHAGPKLVAPAYRLHTALPGGVGPQTSAFREFDSSRPKLVLVRPTDDVGMVGTDDEGLRYERIGVLEGPPEPIRPTEPHPELLAYRRQTGIGALALVGLIAYAKELEDQRRRQRAPRASGVMPATAHSPASSGLPGAWDQEYDYPQQAAL
jgi:hypothetical protein